jgi:TolB-like protein
MTTFGPFVMEAGALTREGRAVALGQRALALLEALAAAEGPVDKAALIEAAWPGTIVEEGNLTVQIAALRKALGTRPDGSEWIVTVPRVGYRLVRTGATERTTSHPVMVLPALAVLPFRNLGGDSSQDYFAEGLVEDIIAALSRFRSFAVIARSASAVYKDRPVSAREAATELGVRYILEGSVRKAGEQVRVTAQLVEGETARQMWSERFEGTAKRRLRFPGTHHRGRDRLHPAADPGGRDRARPP